MRWTRLDLGVAVALAVGTVVAFAPVLRADFIGVDDPFYVFRNPYVQTGLSAANVRWAWTTFTQSNWHPLTWMSLQLDATLFGVNAKAFHAVNLALHAANAVLVFLALRALTGAVWRSALVAALFAVHPLRVESVAWVTERKDVLSVFFGLLALWAWAAYVRRRAPGWYLLAAMLLALSLLAKPMLVTLPCLLLVLDWWPLQRAARPTGSVGIRADVDAVGPIGWPRLVLEKLPLFALVVASSIVTFWAQRAGGSVRPFEDMGIVARLFNSVVAYASYVYLSVWPVALAPGYLAPRGSWPAERLAASALALIVLTGLAVWQRRRRPYVLTGWLWYLGTLVPVIGLVQVGDQPYADRYTYFPSIGLCLALVWTVADWLTAARPTAADKPAPRFGGSAVTGERPVAAGTPAPRFGGAVVAAGVVLVVLGALTWRQAAFWTNDRALWQHTLDVVGPNPVAYSSLGVAIELEEKSTKNALKYYELSVQTEPNYGTGQYNLGRALRDKGDTEGAIEHFRRAVTAFPHLTSALVDWANLLIKVGPTPHPRPEYDGQPYREAELLLLQALKTNPDTPDAHASLGQICEFRGQPREASEQYRAELRLNPDNAVVLTRLGVSLAAQKEFPEALGCLRRAVQLADNWSVGHRNLGLALEQAHQFPEAVESYRRAVQLEPTDPVGRVRLATALARAGNTAEANRQYGEALKLDPKWPDALFREAWRSSVHPDPRKRNGEYAVWGAESICNAVRPPPAHFLDALAAAYAESGRYSEAADVAAKAVEAAKAANQPALADQIAARLALYRQGQPFHVPAAAPAGGGGPG